MDERHELEGAYRPPDAPLTDRPTDPEGPTFDRMSVLLMFLLTLVSAGLYVPIWFLRRRKAFNQLGGDHGVPVFVIVIVCIVASNIIEISRDDPLDTSRMASSARSMGAILMCGPPSGARRTWR